MAVFFFSWIFRLTHVSRGYRLWAPPFSSCTVSVQIAGFIFLSPSLHPVDNGPSSAGTAAAHPRGVYLPSLQPVDTHTAHCTPHTAHRTPIHRCPDALVLCSMALMRCSSVHRPIPDERGGGCGAPHQCEPPHQCPLAAVDKLSAGRSCHRLCSFADSFLGSARFAPPSSIRYLKKLTQLC